MTSPEERIRELARARGMDGTDAERLLAAVRPAHAAGVRTSKNPFQRWSGETTALVGLAVAIAALATSRLGVRYDGTLDLHVIAAPVPIGTALVDQLVAFPLTAAIFFAAARLVSPHARFVDVLGVVGLARLPIVLLAPLLALLAPHISRDPSKPNGALLLLAAISLVGLGLQLALLVIGFRTTTAARGIRFTGSFLGALVAAEIVTKAVLALVF